jgi:hypothetical protein
MLIQIETSKVTHIKRTNLGEQNTSSQCVSARWWRLGILTLAQELGPPGQSRGQTRSAIFSEHALYGAC